MSKKQYKHSDMKDAVTLKLQNDNGDTGATEDGQEIVLTQAELEQIVNGVLAQMGIGNNCVVNLGGFEYRRLQEYNNRRLYLYGEITPPDDYVDLARNMTAANIVENILNINRADAGIPSSKREPIVLYINSPGGSVLDGFSIIEAIKLSKTPVITVNMGKWESMAFLIGIAGHKRLSLPNMIFLMHDGDTFFMNSTSKVYDGARFYEHYHKRVVREHILKYTNMTKKEYKKRLREEFYMLAGEALKYGMIDKIITDIDDIL